MKTINYKANDFLYAASRSALIIQKFKDNIFSNYSNYLKGDWGRERLEVLIDDCLLICLSAREVETGNYLMLAKEYSNTFRELMEDAITHNMYIILEDVRPRLDSETTSEIAEHIAKELFKLVNELTNKALTVTEETTNE